MPRCGDGQLSSGSSAQLCQGTAQRGKQPQLIPRLTLGPEAVVRGWAACPPGGREERPGIHILQRYMHRTLPQGLHWEEALGLAFLSWHWK